MTLLVRVENGTGAGIRRPLADKRTEPWACPLCGHVNKPHFANCEGCTRGRPKP